MINKGKIMDKEGKFIKKGENDEKIGKINRQRGKT